MKQNNFRLRNTVKQTIIENGGPKDAIVVIAGLANSYSHYIATYEEYRPYFFFVFCWEA
jgi:hypothetical protein